MRSIFYKRDEHSHCKYPRHEQKLIAHFENEAIAQWPSFGTPLSYLWPSSSRNSKAESNNDKSHLQLSAAERNALQKARPDPLSGFGPAFFTFMLFGLTLSEDPKTVRADIRKYGANHVRLAQGTLFAFTLVSANEIRLLFKQSKNQDAVEVWEKISNWPFTNANVEPLPRLTVGTCQPMVKALALLRETASTTIEDKGDALSTASLLKGTTKAQSPELRGMLEFAKECERYHRYYEAPPSSSNGLVDKHPPPGPKHQPNAMDTGSTSYRPRKTVLEWLGEQW